MEFGPFVEDRGESLVKFDFEVGYEELKIKFEVPAGEINVFGVFRGLAACISVPKGGDLDFVGVVLKARSFLQKVENFFKA